MPTSRNALSLFLALMLFHLPLLTIPVLVAAAWVLGYQLRGEFVYKRLAAFLLVHGRALAGRAAWITGIRRIDGPTRAAAPVVEWDDRWGVVKINPLVAWSDADLEGYQTAHDLPRHPLASRGYPSIGCWPCTRPVADGEDRRAGRWAGLDKTECGLHLGAAGTDAGTDSAAVAVAVEVR